MHILTNIVTVNEIVGKVFKIQGRYSCSLLSVNYGIPSTIVLNKPCHLFLLQSLALEKYFSINIDLCPICHLFCNFFNSKYIKGIWGLIKKTQGVFHLLEKKKSHDLSTVVMFTHHKNLVHPVKNIFSKKFKGMKKWMKCKYSICTLHSFPPDLQF